MTEKKINSITILGGENKKGEKELLDIVLKPGDIVAIVGPTGSGKSRLLEDLEWLAAGDTPTKRRILINGQEPPRELRYSIDLKLVAQLSQNMNFVMDASVKEFVRMHACSRNIPDPDQVVRKVIETANALAGEGFSEETPITSLSGGQSRGLMIADTAFLSHSPVILIDEIENAGIDRRKALELLVKKEKIILIATHDPILALMAKRRIVIKNGGIVKIIRSGEEEQKSLAVLEKMDRKLLEIRNRLRMGMEINVVVEEDAYHDKSEECGYDGFDALSIEGAF